MKVQTDQDTETRIIELELKVEQMFKRILMLEKCIVDQSINKTTVFDTNKAQNTEKNIEQNHRPSNKIEQKYRTPVHNGKQSKDKLIENPKLPIQNRDKSVAIEISHQKHSESAQKYSNSDIIKKVKAEDLYINIYDEDVSFE